MKLYSPILLLLLVLGSCKEKFDRDTIQKQDSIAHYFHQLYSDTVVTHKKQLADRAVQLSKTTQNDSIAFTALLYKLDYVILPYEPDSTAIYVDRLSTIANNGKSQHNKAYALNRNAEYQFVLQDFQNAFYFYENSRRLFEKENDSLNMVYNLLRMAGIQQFYNDYGGSEQVITEALSYLEKAKIPNQDYLADAYIKLGIAYTAMNEVEQAITYYQKAKSLTHGALQKLMIDNNIALAYHKASDYDRAIQSYKQLLGIPLLRSDAVSTAIIQDNLGHAQFKKDGVSGLPLMQEALQFRRQRNDTKGLAYSFLNIAEYYTKNNQNQVGYYAKKAYENAYQIGAVDQQLKALELLIQYDTDPNKNFQKRYFQLNDSINKVRLSAKNHFAKMRYDASDAIKDNLQHDLEKQQYRNTIISIAAISVLIVLTIFFLYILSRFINKRKIQQQTYHTETRIAKKLHDELANDVFNTMAFAEVKDLSAPENKELLLNNLDSIYEQARNIAKENTTIPMDTGFSQALREMLSTYTNDEVTILINGLETIDWPALQRNKKIVVYRALQELLVNMKKHSQCTLVAITFEKTQKKINIVYSDNGVGMGVGVLSNKNGLQNVETRIQSINGNITFDPSSRKGFKVTFSFNF